MKERRFLYFALGVLAVISVGAVTNQVSPAGAPGLGIGDEGIMFPDGTVLTTADTRRAFYLTDIEYLPSFISLLACQEGYHFASLGEIAEVTNLRYASELDDAHSKEDSGEGPPAERGWIRTGRDSGTNSSPGSGNCELWASIDNAHYGSEVAYWQGFPGVQDEDRFGVWYPSSSRCDVLRRVWCVQD